MRRPAPAPRPGDRLPAKVLPPGILVFSIHTRHLGVVIRQEPRLACVVEFEDGEKRLHPDVVLEVAE